MMVATSNSSYQVDWRQSHTRRYALEDFASDAVPAAGGEIFEERIAESNLCAANGKRAFGLGNDSRFGQKIVGGTGGDAEKSADYEREPTRSGAINRKPNLDSHEIQCNQPIVTVGVPLSAEEISDIEINDG
jgi:hypothetical protein